MRYLTDELWYPFQEGDANRGKKFEDMVALLLKCSEEGKWESTGGGGDGARDFVRLSNVEKKWAECKIHNRPLSLRILSPTLVMAVIENIDEILFFSKTPITAPSLVYLANFAQDTKRHIRVFDDEILENAILSYQEVVGEFFPTFYPTANQPLLKPLIGVELVKDVDIPMQEGLNNCPDFDGETSSSVGYRMWSGLKARSFGIPSLDSPLGGIPSLDFNEVFALDIHIRNTDPFCKKTCTVDWTGFEETNFQRLDKLKDASSPYSFIINPGEIVRKRYLFRAVRPAELVTLPKATLSFDDGTTITTGDAEATVRPRIYPPLVGESHLNIVSEFKQKSLHGAQRARIFSIYGKAGTGKSRLVREIRDEVMIFGKDVTVINGEDQGGSTFNSFIRRVIANAYRLPLVDLGRRSGLEKDVKPNEAETTESAINRLLYEPDYVPSDHIKNCLDLLLSLPQKRHLIIMVDNIQDFDEHTIEFLDRLRINLAGVHKPINIVLVFNTDRTHPGSKASSLHHSLRQMAEGAPDHFSSLELGDLRPSEAQHLVNECINWEVNLYTDGGPSFGPEVFDRLLQDRTLRPLFIVQFLFYLIDLKALDYHEGRLVVLDPSILQSALLDVPPKIQDLFYKRWQLIRDNSELCDDFSEIVVLLAMCGGIRRNDLAKLGIRRNAFIALLDVGFLSIEFGQIRFYHTELFRHFSKKSQVFEVSTVEKSKVSLERAKLSDHYWVGYFLILAHLSEVNGEAVHLSLKGIRDNAFVTPYNYKIFLETLYEYLDESWGLSSPERTEAHLLICEEIKRYVSYREGLKHYRHAYARVESHVAENDLALRSLSAFVVEYANAHFAVHLEAQALPVLDSCKTTLEKRLSTHSPENLMAIAAIDNRRSVSLKYLRQFSESTQAAKEALSSFTEFGGARELFDGHVDYANALKEEPACKKNVLKHWELALKAIDNISASELPTYISGAAAFTKAQVLILNGKHERAFEYAGTEAELCRRRYDHYNVVNLYVTQLVAALAGGLEVGHGALLNILDRAEDVCTASAVVRFPWVLAHLRAKTYRMANQSSKAATNYVLAMRRLHSIGKYEDYEPMDGIHEYFYREYAVFFSHQDHLIPAHSPLKACRSGLRPWVERIIELTPDELAAYVKGWTPMTIYSSRGEDLPSV